MTDWTQAACLNADPDVMFPDKGQSPEPAKRICAVCPLVTDCLEAALANAEAFGVWGGLAFRERRQVAEMGGWPRPSREGSAHPPTRCGTEAGYRRHMRADERPCEACRRAHQVRYHDRKAAA